MAQRPTRLAQVTIPDYSPGKLYTGDEPAIASGEMRPDGADEYFQVSKQPFPKNAIPVVDDDRDTVIGYTRIVEGNTWVLDLDGGVVMISEPGSENPLIDPIDALFLVGALGRLAIKGAARVGLDFLGDVVGKTAVTVFWTAATSTLRVAFRRLIQRELQFTATTAARMADRTRYVPLDILKLAVRYGVRDADPDKVVGAFRYAIPMLKAGKRLGEPQRRYMLYIIVRERDWTILHFHYER